jgi:metal-sulfur cluster biosynthetic enzyme
VNIVDLGLVYGITVTQDHEAPGFQPRYNVAITLTMRAPSDDREAMLLGQVKNRLAGMQQVSGSKVDLVWEPAWTADRMTAAACQQLGLDRAPKQGLVSIKL